MCVRSTAVISGISFVIMLSTASKLVVLLGLRSLMIFWHSFVVICFIIQLLSILGTSSSSTSMGVAFDFVNFGGPSWGQLQTHT